MSIGIGVASGLPRGEWANRSSRLSFRNIQVALHLQANPELWSISEPVGESQRRFASDPTLAVDDLSDPVCGNVELTRQLSRRHAIGFKPLGENFTRMMDCCRHVSLQNERAAALGFSAWSKKDQAYLQCTPIVHCFSLLYLCTIKVRGARWPEAAGMREGSKPSSSDWAWKLGGSGRECDIT